MLDFIRSSLSGKLLIVLSVSVAVVMAAVIYFTVMHQTEEMLTEMRAHAEETAASIYAGIKYPMSVGDSGAVEKQLFDIKEKMRDVDIFIADYNRQIAFSTRTESIHSDMKNYLYNDRAISDLPRALEDAAYPGSSYEEEINGIPYLLHMNPVQNQKICFGCHGPERQVLGAIILRKPTARNYAAITHLRNDSILISVLGLVSLVCIVHKLMVRMVSRPVSNLAEEIERLPEKIVQGSALIVPDIKRRDEIGHLQNSFYQMAVEIDEKNRVIENSSNQLVKANKELEAFAYSVSHDLRAPLRNIDGFSKILIDEFSEKLDDQARHYLKRVRDGTIRMSLLIDDILTFSRIGRSSIQLKTTNCREVIAPVIENYAEEIKRRSVKITIGELPAIKCDFAMMQSLFSNLVSNALKFTKDTQKPEIVIGYDNKKKAFFVRDNGIGFDMQYHDKIFQVFQRLHLPEEYEGTGIGLAIVKRVAERHHSKVWADGHLGKGAIFYVSLPLQKEER